MKSSKFLCLIFCRSPSRSRPRRTRSSAPASSTTRPKAPTPSAAHRVSRNSSIGRQNSRRQPKSRFIRPRIQTMNQVIAAYNLAYQMSRMPQNLAARYKSDFAQWTNLSIRAAAIPPASPRRG